MIRPLIASAVATVVLLGSAAFVLEPLQAQVPPRDSVVRPPSSETRQDRVLNSAPDWFFSQPADTAFVLMAATATAEDLQVALDKARFQARVNIAEQLESRIEALGKRFIAEAGGAHASELSAQYELTAKNVVSKVLVGSRVRDQQWYAEGKLYRVYVLLELPVSASKRELVSEVKESPPMYLRFRASKAFKDLEREVAKLPDGGA